MVGIYIFNIYRLLKDELIFTYSTASSETEDRILNMARTAVNVVGNSLAAVVISKWEASLITKKIKST